MFEYVVQGWLTSSRSMYDFALKIVWKPLKYNMADQF